MSRTQADTQKVVHATFVLEQTYPHPVAKVFNAFADSELKSRWLQHPQGPQAGDSYQQDFRTGRREHNKWVMGADTPLPGAIIASDGMFLDIVENRRIVSAASMMMNGTPFSGSLLTFEFEADGDSTRLICTHHGAFLENSDGPQMREDGWKKLFERLEAVLNS
jgi:uncharacterized protein YndB with AHSA1/START domain